MTAQRHCLALDLKDDPALIAEYEALHRQIWRLGTRLFMVMDTACGFDPEAFARAGASDPHVQAWEALMWRFQQPTPWTARHQKWTPMAQIFSLHAPHTGATGEARDL